MEGIAIGEFKPCTISYTIEWRLMAFESMLLPVHKLTLRLMRLVCVAAATVNELWTDGMYIVRQSYHACGKTAPDKTVV